MKQAKECSANSHPNVAQLGPDAAINRLLSKIVQVGVFGQPFEIAVTKVDGCFEGDSGLIVVFREAKAAREIVKNQRIPRTQEREFLIDPQAGQELTTPGVIVPEELESVQITWIALNNPFQKPYFDVQVAFLGAR